MKKLASSLLCAIACYSTANAQIKITSTNNIGIGTEIPNHPLDIKMPRTNFSQSNAPFRIEVANSDPRLTSTNKVIFYNTSHSGHIPIEASAFYTMSDERLKANIQTLSNIDRTASPLQKILSLNGYSYQWKHELATRKASDTEPQKQIGFLAQELEKVIPEAVNKGDDSLGMKSVTYNQVIPYLVEAIKEQQVMIDALKKEVLLLSGQKSTTVIEQKKQTAILPTKNEK